MTRRFVLDTNVIWYGFKDEAYRERIFASYWPLHFSAVTLAELASHADSAGRGQLEQARTVAAKARRVFAPTTVDWNMVGGYLFDHRPKGRTHLSAELRLQIARMQNDALIAVSSWSRGWSVVTCDGDDFQRLAAYFPHFAERLIVEAAPA